MNTNINRLEKFRTDTYNLLGFAKDSTYDLMDAVLTTRTANSLADFSLSPLFKRQWPSTYESLQDCRPNRSKLMELYIKEIPATDGSYLTLAIDHTAYPLIRFSYFKGPRLSSFTQELSKSN